MTKYLNTKQRIYGLTDIYSYILDKKAYLIILKLRKLGILTKVYENIIRANFKLKNN